MRVGVSTLWIALVAACGSAREDVPATNDALDHYEGVGQYLFHTTGSLTTVTINHEEVPGFMRAMAMPYAIEDVSLVRVSSPEIASSSGSWSRTGLLLHRSHLDWAGSGRTTVNVIPPSGSGATSMRPPCSFTIR